MTSRPPEDFRILDPCTCEIFSKDDPDCELHNPEQIEDDEARWLAQRYFHAGATTAVELMLAAIEVGNHRWHAYDMTLSEMKDSHTAEAYEEVQRRLRERNPNPEMHHHDPKP